MTTDEKYTEAANQTKRSLAWRWPMVVIVFLSITVFCLCWVKVTSIEASKDVQVMRIATLQR